MSKLEWSVEQAAKHWGISPQRVRLLCSQGKAKCRKRGYDWVITSKRRQVGKIKEKK